MVPVFLRIPTVNHETGSGRLARSAKCFLFRQSGYNCSRGDLTFRRAHYSFNFNVTGMSDVTTMNDEERELAEVIVSALNLETPAAEIDPEAPLYGEGLGLDSIDILEIALAVSKRYGVQIRSDDNDNVRIFSSLRSLNEHVQQQRAA
jgi:acyl carrier protein